MEGMDALDPGTPASKGGYHDDSDEVSVGVPASPHGDLPPSNGSAGRQDGELCRGQWWVTVPSLPRTSWSSGTAAPMLGTPLRRQGPPVQAGPPCTRCLLWPGAALLLGGHTHAGV